MFLRSLEVISGGLYDLGCHFLSDQSTYVTDQFAIPLGSTIWKK